MGISLSSLFASIRSTLYRVSPMTMANDPGSAGAGKVAPNKPAIEIPQAYRSLTEWERLDPKGRVDHRVLRYFGRGTTLYPKDAYVVDPDSAELQVLLEQSRLDSKQLEKALHQVFRERELPIWVLRRKRRPSQKDTVKMSFLIRPLYFRSVEEKTETNRLQWPSDRFIFVMHFDPKHTLQTIRIFYDNTSKEKYFRSEVCGYTTRQLVDDDNIIYFKENYGNWRAMAERIADVLEISNNQFSGKLFPT